MSRRAKEDTVPTHPETIGKYKIQGLIAKGGMGAVYKAMHPTLKRNVILKKLTIRGNTAITERFKREAQILLDFNDPHIVHLFDYFKEGSSHYIVLEYVDGMSLDVLLKKRRYLSGALSLFVFLDACKALKYAHDHGVIHRDIKPGNILISRKGAVKLADFGIAAVEQTDEQDLTKEGVTLGTASYMPPEQFKNSKNVDKRADIYAMGVMLYEMVSGKRPFPGNFAPDTLLSIQKGRYTPIKKINPETPPVIARLIRKMIRPNPKRRYRNMGAIIRIVENYLKRLPVDSLRESLVQCITNQKYEEPVFKPRKKKRLVALSLAAGMVLLAAAGCWAWSQGLVHRIFLAKSYGAVQFKIRIPETVKEPGDILLTASIFVHDREEFPPATEKDIVFSCHKDTSGPSGYRFESNTVYLKPGMYRAKITAEQRIYWQSFTLESLAERETRGSAIYPVEISFDRVTPQPLLVRTEAFDAVTNRILTSATQYSVLRGNNWIPLQTLLPGDLMTGQVLKFRADQDGYYPEIFSLKIAPYQTELVLRANLIPLPGTLSLEAPAGSYRIFLNGSETIVRGGEIMIRETLEGYSGGPKSWDIPSGRYDFEIISGERILQSRIDIVPGETTRLIVRDTDGLLLLYKE